MTSNTSLCFFYGIKHPQHEQSAGNGGVCVSVCGFSSQGQVYSPHTVDELIPVLLVCSALIESDADL